MNVLTTPAHLATLAVEGVVTVAVVDALPTQLSEWHEAFKPGLPLDLTGQRIGIRAAEDPDWRSAIIPIGASESLRHIVVHPGCIVGSAVVEAVVPIYHIANDPDPDMANIITDGVRAWYYPDDFHPDTQPGRDLTDQLAFQSFPPGKTALIFTDAKPCEQRCPAHGDHDEALVPCAAHHSSACDCQQHEGDGNNCPAPTCGWCSKSDGDPTSGTCAPIPYTASETWSVL